MMGGMSGEGKDEKDLGMFKQVSIIDEEEGENSVNLSDAGA